MHRILIGLVLALAACSSGSPLRLDGGLKDGLPSPDLPVSARTCDELANLYATALAAAQACDPSQQTGQCEHTVRDAIFCGCPTRANDTTGLDALVEEFQAEGCDHDPSFHPVCVAGCARQIDGVPCEIVQGAGRCAPIF
jgi:hypothetical protein